MRRSGASEQLIYQPEPGIYETDDGKYVAFDDRRESMEAEGNEGYWELETWLRSRGLRVSTAALFLTCGLLSLSHLPHYATRARFDRFVATRLEYDVFLPRARSLTR